MKNPLAVRQQGTLDLIMTSTMSFRSSFPSLFIDNSDQGAEYTAEATAVLSCTKQSQL